MRSLSAPSSQDLPNGSVAEDVRGPEVENFPLGSFYALAPALGVMPSFMAPAPAGDTMWCHSPGGITPN